MMPVVHKLGSQVVGVSNFSGVQMLVDPAANTKGLIVRSVVLGEGDRDVGVFVGTVAPASHNEVGVACINRMLSGSHQHDKASFPIMVPPGFGVWAAVSGVAQVQSYAQMSYDLL